MKFIDHEIKVIPKGLGTLSGKSVYKVYCETCQEEVHPGTTAPGLRVAEHLATCMDCGFEVPFGPFGYVHTTVECNHYKGLKKM